MALIGKGNRDPDNIVQVNLPVLGVSLGDIALQMDAFQSIVLSASEEQVTPRFVIRLADLNSQYLETYEGLGIGTVADVSILEGDVDNENATDALVQSSPDLSGFKFSNMMVSAVTEQAQRGETGIGLLEIMLDHPWILCQDCSCHAYAGQSNSSIIEDILMSDTRGFSFDSIDDICESSESGEIPRYKLGSDYDFIVNNIVPNTLINKKPAIFFIDERGRVHLTNFTNMYNKAPNLTLVFGDEADVQDAWNSNKITTDYAMFAYGFKFECGSPNPNDIVKILKMKVALDDSASGIVQIGKLYPKISIGSYSESSTSDNCHIPVSLQSLISSDSTSFDVFRHRQFDDLLAIAQRQQEPFNRMMTMTVNCPFCGQYVITGDNINIVFPASKSIGGNHIFNGKWHVRSVAHTWDSSTSTLSSILTVCRPSFSFNKKATGLYNYSQYYEIGLL